jgi:hypothetical protein
MIKLLILAVVKVNVYKQEVGYDDRRSTVIVGLSAKEKRKAFAEKFMFKFEPESKRHCGKRTFFHDPSSFAFHVINKRSHDVSCRPSAVL